MKELTIDSPESKEWSDYLKSQMDSWPEWKRATSSYSYVPLTHQQTSICDSCKN